MVEWRQEEALEVPVLEDEVGIEPDFVDGRKSTIEKSRPQVDESVGSDECGGEGGFTIEPAILAHCVHC